jgi:RIO-like serine/threonine protein kinase
MKATQLSYEHLTDNVERNLFAAYRALHKRQVLHGDIRKENILVSEDESVYIIDFDNASIMSEDDVGLILREDEEIMSMLKKLKSDDDGMTSNGNSH